LTFVPRQCTESALAGDSDVIGQCQVALNSVDQLLFGAAIKKSAEEQVYGAWELNDAVEPQFLQEGADADNPDPTAGPGSILSGKAAPDFQLDLLGGGQLKLSEQKGSVIVLDFWASWCGPCMHAMPQTDKVVAEFKNRKVKLVTVNMQEDQEAINGALERLNIHPIVAMDVDGAVAERYQVSAIPQVVVIDTESNVAGVLIGANAGFADQLRAAIEKSLTAKPAPPKP
jgi:thiol-disulfide isomerase/thioredoxin